MKRSQINAILRRADAFLSELKFRLPPFAYWTPDEWRRKGSESRAIVERQLGWDITDFGLGDFERTGLFLFTLRNGTPANLKRGEGIVYAEKAMVVEVGQVTPMHFHWAKTEDIINRGGGQLVIQLYNATKGDTLGDDPVAVEMDGVATRSEPGSTVVLSPGESITLPPRLFHTFWGSGSRVLVGEVSTVNDDATDNRFLEPLGRFPDVEADEPPAHLLVGDYPSYYRPTR